MYSITIRNKKFLLDIEEYLLKGEKSEVPLNTNRIIDRDIIYLKLNNLCNINCIYCYQQQEERYSDSYNIQDYMEIFADVLRRENTDVVIFGGEPLIMQNVDKLDFIFSLCGNQRKIIFFTNASYSSHFNEYLKSHRAAIRQLVVTIDGPEKVHNSRRISKENGYRNILENVAFYEKHKIPFGLQVNVDKSNFDYVDSLINELEKCFDMGKLQIVYNRVLHSPDSISDIDFLKGYSRLREKYRSYNLGINYPTVAKLKYLLHNKGVYRQRCRAGNTLVYDFSTKKIYACPQSSETTIGGFDFNSFHIDKNLNARISKCSNKDNDNCRNCNFIDLCKYGCCLEENIDYSSCKQTTDSEVRYILDNIGHFIGDNGM